MIGLKNELVCQMVVEILFQQFETDVEALLIIIFFDGLSGIFNRCFLWCYNNFCVFVRLVIVDVFKAFCVKSMPEFIFASF